jgi:ABC-2 type transport system ATP-binding protein
VLEFDDVAKRYGATVALESLTFAVQPGQMFGFVGANGAGKTTAMRIALGVLAADRGEVRWSGKPVDFAARQRFGYMPEERGLYPKMRVAEQLGYFAQLHGLAPTAAAAAAREWTGRLGVAERRNDPVEKLSLGNQQRVQLAAALVYDPEVLILDEPFSGLDPVGVDALADVLKAKCAEGVPVIFSSHQLELVERLCDSVGIINSGRLVAAGTVEELRNRAAARQLRVVAPSAQAGWADGIAGVRTVSQRSAEFVLALDDDADDQLVLAAALRTGRVEHFSRVTPSLTELFRETVAPQDVAERQPA